VDSYLFKAPDEDMARWKACAKDNAMSFANWLRLAANQLEGTALDPKDVVKPRNQPGTKRTFAPDPK